LPRRCAPTLPPAAAVQAASPLLQLPAEILAVVLARLDTRYLARLASTCRLCRDAPTPPPPPHAIGAVESELRRRAEARGLDVGSSLPEGLTSWVACLLKRDRRDAQMRQAPLAVGHEHSMFVDTQGRLLTCGSDSRVEPVLGHAMNPAADLNIPREIGPPTPVPPMQDRRIVSVATSHSHCLALSADGEVYSWGSGRVGELGYGNAGIRAVPIRIESLSSIERIAVGRNCTSAAVDEKGRLFTWGRASFIVEFEGEYGELRESEGPCGLGYELDAETVWQATPKQVDALSQDRVVCVALGFDFTLAVNDAGAVFSFGSSWVGGLGHGLSDVEVLPRRIEALTQTRRRFVAVAAGDVHALALTEEGELYGWGYRYANGHGREERTPQLVAALIGQCVKLVNAHWWCSCAVTEKGELFTWSAASAEGAEGNLGHEGSQGTPTRVAGLRGVEVVAVAISGTHTLVADADGVVWAFGRRSALGLGASGPADSAAVPTPTPIPTLRARVLNSP